MRRVNVQGYNGDIDAGTEDLYPGGGTVSVPAAAAATTVVSSDAADTAAGTGARTVRVKGLNSDLREISEDVTMAGATPVTLTNEFYRINSLEVLTAGSGEANAGTIDVKHSSTVLFRMVIGENRARTAIFTASVNAKCWAVKKFYMSLTNAAAVTVVGALLTRKPGGLWQKRFELAVNGTSPASQEVDVNIELEPGEDVKVAGTSSGANSAVSGGCDVVGGSFSEVFG